LVLRVLPHQLQVAGRHDVVVDVDLVHGQFALLPAP
jgi:hypothetical protein